MWGRVSFPILVAVTLIVGMAAVALADQAPIAGVVKAVDATAKTITVDVRARGKVREVVIEMRPETRVVRVVRSTEQPARLEDIQPGWTVSVTTRHEGSREVAQLVRVIREAPQKP